MYCKPPIWTGCWLIFPKEGDLLKDHVMQLYWGEVHYFVWLSEPTRKAGGKCAFKVMSAGTMLSPIHRCSAVSLSIWSPGWNYEASSSQLMYRWWGWGVMVVLCVFTAWLCWQEGTPFHLFRSRRLAITHPAERTSHWKRGKQKCFYFV